MKIVHLIFSFNTGGSETMLVDIVNEQVTHNDVNILIINKHYNAALISKVDERVKVHYIGRKEGSMNPWPIIKLNYTLINLRADVIHCHNHNIIPLIIPQLRKKSVLTLHSMGIPTKYLAKFNKVFAISESVANDVKKRSNIRPEVIYNGIKTEEIKVKETYKRNKTFEIVCVARLDHLTKGQHILIEALRVVIEDKKDADMHIDFIGEGDSEIFLRELVNSYKLNSHVRFLGLKDRDYIYSHLRDYNLLLQPSLNEGFGLTVVEGMVAKIPVLVSDIDGPMEIIQNGKYGFYFQSGNADDLANKLNRIMTESITKLIEQMTEEAYQYVLTNYNIRGIALKYVEKYRNE